jgi:hypothetical protein
VTYLDCQNIDAALSSFAAACRRPVDDVAQAISSYAADWSEFEPQFRTAGPREVLQLLDVASADIEFEGAYYFHGTRTFDAAMFSREGILPLNQVTDRLWVSLYGLVADTATDVDWRRLREGMETGALGHHSYLYWLKTKGSSGLGGPYALLAREQHYPREGHHNYLAIPEIVEDIARCCDLDLARRFQEATTSCVVKFLHTDKDMDILHAVFWYIHGMLHDGKPGWLAQCDYDGRGSAVLPGDVMAVELVR